MTKLTLMTAAAATALFAAPALALTPTTPSAGAALAAPGQAAPSTTGPSTMGPSTAAPSDSAAAPTTFSDVQLRSFVAASGEITQIQARPNAATDPQAVTDMHAVLQRHNLDSATYNAIAARARTDTAFAARLAQLRTTTRSE